MAIQKLSHVEIGINDAEDGLQFHRETLGLIELGRSGDSIYLGCGIDNNADVILTPGGTGVKRIAFDVTSDDDLDLYAGRLDDAGIKTQLRSDPDPGVGKALQFTAPSGHVIELVTLKESVEYLSVARAVHPRGTGIAPQDIDHVTVMLENGKEFTEFFTQLLDFRASDLIKTPDGGYFGGWLHTSDYQHDMAFLTGGGFTLHHLAWTLDNIEHMKRSADLLSHAELPIEVGPGRHVIGSNLFTYFKAPGGNRYELSAEMGRAANRAAGPNYWDIEEFAQVFSAWGQLPPPGFELGS